MVLVKITVPGQESSSALLNGLIPTKLKIQSANYGPLCEYVRINTDKGSFGAKKSI